LMSKASSAGGRLSWYLCAVARPVFPGLGIRNLLPSCYWTRWCSFRETPTGCCCAVKHSEVCQPGAPRRLTSTRAGMAGVGRVLCRWLLVRPLSFACGLRGTLPAGWQLAGMATDTAQQAALRKSGLVATAEVPVPAAVEAEWARLGAGDHYSIMRPNMPLISAARDTKLCLCALSPSEELQRARNCRRAACATVAHGWQAATGVQSQWAAKATATP
jgi:hypothetical protein